MQPRPTPQAGPALRSAPDFIVLGAQKCGTTSLFSWLSAHPRVRPPSRKEVHFFDTQFLNGKQWYMRHFPPPEPDTWTGEASPYYLPHPLAPGRIAATCPNARLIVALRNPIDRALSHYHHIRRTRLEPLSFPEALALEPLRLEGEEEKLCRDPRYHSLNHRRFGYLARGLYADQIQRWLRHFPREQIHIFLFEDLCREPGRVLTEVEDFIGLPRWVPASFPAQNGGGRYPPMHPKLRATLAEFYRIPNQRLAALLGRDPGWT